MACSGQRIDDCRTMSCPDDPEGTKLALVRIERITDGPMLRPTQAPDLRGRTPTNSEEPALVKLLIRGFESHSLTARTGSLQHPNTEREQGLPPGPLRGEPDREQALDRARGDVGVQDDRPNGRLRQGRRDAPG